MAVSDQIKEELVRSGIRAERIVTVRNAVEISERDGAERKRKRLRSCKKADEFIVGIIGRLSPEKEIATFLRAAGHVARRHAHIKFMVVGDGPMKNELENLSKSLGIGERVRFTGFVRDMTSAYDLLDAVVISSSTEGIPLVLLEAMKHGLPVVCTRVGGIPEVVENGVNGILVDPFAVEQMVEAMELLMFDKATATTLGENAQRKILKHHNQILWIKEIEKIYYDLLCPKK